MPLYNIKSGGGRTVARIETTTHGRIKATTGAFHWALGKALPTLSEWCNRKHMTVHAIVATEDKEAALAELRKQGDFFGADND